MQASSSSLPEGDTSACGTKALDVPLRRWILCNCSSAQVCTEWAASDSILLPRSPADVAASESWAPSGLRCFEVGRHRLPPPLVNPISVSELPIEQGGIGSRVWDSSLGLACWASLNPSAFAAKRVLELGSGTGLGGLSVAAAGAHSVVLSDFAFSNASSMLSGSTPQDPVACCSPLLDNLQNNAEINQHLGRLSVRPLDWQTASVLGSFEAVVASDCIYTAQIVPALVDVIVRHTGKTGEAVIISPSVRTGLDQFVLDLERAVADSGRKLRKSSFTLHQFEAIWLESRLDGWQHVGGRVADDLHALEQVIKDHKECFVIVLSMPTFYYHNILWPCGTFTFALVYVCFPQSRAQKLLQGVQQQEIREGWGHDAAAAAGHQKKRWRRMPWMVPLTVITIT